MDDLGKDETLTAKILRFVMENPGVSVKDVAGYLAISPNLARNVLQRLRDKGLVRKEGRGFYITQRGEWLLSRTKTSRVEEVGREQVVEPPAEARVPETSVTETPSEEKWRLLEERIRNLEERLRRVEEIVARFAKASEQSGVPEPPRGEAERGKQLPRPPKPVMSVQEALAQYPGMLEQWRIEGAVVQVGNLVVDRRFLAEFSKKFPLSVEDVERLDPVERALFEELRREALVILHSGREYRLVKNLG
ncbi:winged helix-turn-helix transcriptional regulator [Thermogladius sp.]|uniref:winged helix-turn-helix transcriptional regulator n=1 Tax=Thermogladius sp. TaxID=2023064 RepID=UPI003D0E0F0B